MSKPHPLEPKRNLSIVDVGRVALVVAAVVVLAIREKLTGAS